MAKKLLTIDITKSDFNGIIANQEFASIQTVNQVGDRFYVPTEALLLVLGTSINMRDRNGNEVLNEDGTVRHRQAAQRFCAVRVDDKNRPVNVVELYVGQLVKIDINRKIVYPGVLSAALRAGDKAFKEAICGKVLEITEEGTCKDRHWNTDLNQYERDAEGKFVPEVKRCLKFEPKVSALSAADKAKSEEMLTQYYTERYAEYVTVNTHDAE